MNCGMDPRSQTKFLPFFSDRNVESPQWQLTLSNDSNYFSLVWEPRRNDLTFSVDATAIDLSWRLRSCLRPFLTVDLFANQRPIPGIGTPGSYRADCSWCCSPKMARKDLVWVCICRSSAGAFHKNYNQRQFGTEVHLTEHKRRNLDADKRGNKTGFIRGWFTKGETTSRLDRSGKGRVGRPSGKAFCNDRQSTDLSWFMQYNKIQNRSLCAIPVFDEIAVFCVEKISAANPIDMDHPFIISGRGIGVDILPPMPCPADTLMSGYSQEVDELTGLIGGIHPIIANLLYPKSTVYQIQKCQSTTVNHIASFLYHLFVPSFWWVHQGWGNLV